MKKIFFATPIVIFILLIILFNVNRSSPQVMVYEINNKSAVGTERIKDHSEIGKWTRFHADVEKIGSSISKNDFSFDNVNFQVQYNNGNKERPITFIYDIIYSKDYVLVRDSDDLICFKIPIEVFESYHLLNFKNR